MSTDQVIMRIIQLVEQSRCSLQDEKRTQVDLAKVFAAGGIEASREHRLSAGDIPDFFVDGVVVEVKIKGQRTAIYRQIERYCGYPEVKGVVLVTCKSIHLPVAINGLPARVASLSKAWL